MPEPIARHTLARVERQQDAQRQLIERDAVDDLRDTVVGQRKILGPQAADRLAAARHGDVELHDFDAATKHWSVLCVDDSSGACDDGCECEKTGHDACAAWRSQMSIGMFTPPT